MLILCVHSDPSLRLGAWENPPKDIMNSPFFRNIEWDAIYERRQDGPHVPDLPSFMTNNRRRGTEFGNAEREVSVAIPEVWKKLDFSPAPIDRMTILDPEKEKAEAEARREKAKKREEEDDQDESELISDDSEDAEEGEIPMMRDSVFVTTDGNNLPDWSFIDEAVLMSYVTAAAEGKTSGKKKKKGSKKEAQEQPAAPVEDSSKKEESVVMETIPDENVNNEHEKQSQEAVC